MNLFPCPFCGSTSIDPTGWASTDCAGPACDNCNATADTVQTWNRRVAKWQPIKTAPKNEMFIWAIPKGGGKWGLGLAYPNVSGRWSDAYGDRCAPREATLWAPLPPPPGSEQLTGPQRPEGER